MIFTKHRFEIWGPTQHPYKHSLDEYFYSNLALPNVSNVVSALDWLVAVLYPNTQGTVADLTALNAITGQQELDSYVVLDDGDGKAATYRWEQREGDVAPKWYKIYDMDWGEESVLSNFLNKTQDIYVYKHGIDDLDSDGNPLTGINAGQHIYGGNSANTNLTLHANSGDGTGPQTGYIQFEDDLRPTTDNSVDLGTNTERIKTGYFGTSLLVSDFTISSGTILNSGGSISFGDENLNTTGDITASNVLIDFGSALAPSLRFTLDPDTGLYGADGQISLSIAGVESLQLNANQLLNINGSSTAPAYSFLSDPNTGMFRSAEDTLGFSINGSTKLQINNDGTVGIGSYAANNFLTVATPVGYSNPATTIFNYGTNDSLIVQTTDSGGFDAFFLRNDEAPASDGATVALARARGTAIARTKLLAGDAIGNLTSQGYSDTIGFAGLGATLSFVAEQDFDGTGVGSGVILSSTAIGAFTPTPHVYLNSTGNLGVGVNIATSKLHVVGDTQIDNININGNTISSTDLDGNILLVPNGTGILETHSSILPDLDNTHDLGSSTKTFNDLYLKNSLSDGSLSIAVSTILSFRDAVAGAADGHTLFYDTATGRFLPSTPDSEVDHGTISNLNLDHHLQYLLLQGRSGGQAIIGGTDAADGLTLESTSNATKGLIQTKDDFVAFTNANFSGGWQGTDLGGSANNFRNIYSKGEHFGLRLENVTDVTIPSFSANNIGRLVFNTDTKKALVDIGTEFRPISMNKYVSDLTFNGTDLTKDVDVSAFINDARNAIIQLKDNTNDFENLNVTIKATSASNVRIETSIALPSGSYRLIVIE